ncbi:MAG: hypothetical protein WC444_05600 [Candidatus Paceibacterota bacterium]
MDLNMDNLRQIIGVLLIGLIIIAGALFVYNASINRISGDPISEQLNDSYNPYINYSLNDLINEDITDISISATTTNPTTTTTNTTTTTSTTTTTLENDWIQDLYTIPETINVSSNVSIILRIGGDYGSYLCNYSINISGMINQTLLGSSDVYNNTNTTLYQLNNTEFSGGDNISISARCKDKQTGGRYTTPWYPVVNKTVTQEEEDVEVFIWDGSSWSREDNTMKFTCRYGGGPCKALTQTSTQPVLTVKNTGVNDVEVQLSLNETNEYHTIKCAYENDVTQAMTLNTSWISIGEVTSGDGVSYWCWDSILRQAQSWSFSFKAKTA